MSDLRPCSGCRRHVAIAETSCPFCGVEVAPVRGVELAPAASPTPVRGRLSRAAVFAGAALAGVAGCGGKTKPVDSGGPGAGGAIVDAGVTTEPDAAELPRRDERPMPMPYGAPPARRRLV